jgi:hypothetical protein
MSDTKTETRLAKVVHFSDPAFGDGPLEVVINRGLREGVKPGDRFLVFGVGPHILDPDTSKDLGELEVVRGRGLVVHVQEHLATLRTTERRRTRPAKRIIRDRSDLMSRYIGALGTPGNVNEEELAPEAEMPFEAVRLGDLAKPI